MKRLNLITLTLVFCIFSSGIAGNETIRGKIEMSLQNTPKPTLELNLNKTFFNLLISSHENNTAIVEYAKYTDMIDGVFIRIYDNKAINSTNMADHYKNVLKMEKWEDLLKIKDKFSVSLLFADAPGIVNGVFISYTDQHLTAYANVYGKIDFEKLGTLMGKIIESAPEFMEDI